MKQISTIIIAIFSGLLLTSTKPLYAQNTSGNAWQVWTPDRNTGAETNRNAFSVNTLTGRLQSAAPVNTGRCYGLGNDKRGYVYFGDETNLQIHCMDPITNTILSSLAYGTNISSPHSFQSFYIAATNKHYIAISESSSDINSVGTVTILDVTNPNAITFEKNILVPNTTATGTRSTGLDLVQSNFSSSGTTLYISVDDGRKIGVGGSATTGIFLSVNDPLATTPTINAYRTFYPFGTGLTTFTLEYSHSIQVDDANNKVYVSGTSSANLFGINLGAILSFSTTGVPTYNVYLYNLDLDLSQPELFHTISFNKNGSDFYVGSGYDNGGNRAYRFTTQPDKTLPTVILPSAISPVLNYGLPLPGPGFAMGVNLLPDASKLYAIIENNYGFTNTSKMFDLDPVTLAIISTVKNKAGTADETFGYIDPHSYAFNIYDYGDAPATYGIAAHYLNNNDYINDRLRIGATIDADSAIVFSANFDGDNARITPKTNDEDGITAVYIAGTSGLWYGMTGTYAVPNIQVQNTTSPAVTATLFGWMDFNHDGVFQSTEGTSVSVPNGTTNVGLSFTIPATVTTGRAILRLRLTTDPSVTIATPASIAFDGEAEDYVFPATINVSGNIFNDANGNNVYGTSGLPGSGENGTTGGGVNLYAYMIINSLIVDSAKVTADGSFLFKNVQQNMGAATVVIGSNSITPGAASASVNNISTNPPSGWVYTGSSVTGTDNGTLNTIGVTIGSSAVAGLNFGIEQPPVAYQKTQTVTHPTGNAIPAGTATQPVTGLDAEDGPLTNSNTIVITMLPANALMYYGGTLVTINQSINNFNPALLSYTGISNGSSSVVFNYAFKDAATVQGASVAYTINWLIALPINLISFTAIAKDCNSVLLNWKVSDAVNFSRFEIERSTDGANFKTVSVVAYTAAMANYNFSETIIEKGSYQYRLKMIDSDGKIKYSAVSFIRLDCNQRLIIVYPNPVKDKVTMNGLKGGEQVKMYNSQGQLVYTKISIAYQLDIDMTNFGNGMYYIIVTDKNGEKISESRIAKVDE